MTSAQVFGLGVVIVLGMALQAALMRAPAVVTIPSAAAATAPAAAAPAAAESVELEKTRADGAQVQALIARGPATTLVVGDHTLVVRTDWHSKGGDLQVTNTYYEYKDGKLVQVPLVQTVAEPR